MLKTVSTENGTVRGIQGNNARVSVFKGIPFAAPPVGENRWRAPQPASDWDGVRDCSRFAPISVQDTPGIDGTGLYDREWHVDPDIEIDEDCLYLNVWTNAKSDTDKLPVLIWFFGGGFQWGYPREMEMNGEQIAKRGVVFVSVNYRLNAFGFLAHEELKKESPDAPGNFGLLDQQAGIKWVKRNIAAFGGDPDNITIMGQSAGGGSVFSHLTGSSQGLFHKAVMLSGIIGFPYFEDFLLSPLSYDEAAVMGDKFIKSLGVDTIEEARKLDAFFICDKAREFREKNNFFYSPCVDGKFLTGTPARLFAEGKHAHIPLMSGNTGDEFKSYINAESDSEFEDKAREIFGDKAEKFLSYKNVYNHTGNQYAEADGIECAVKAVFEHNDRDSYYYFFNPDIPGWDNPGSFHSVDLWFFFETLGVCWRPFVGRHYDLARKMCNYLTNFVKTGNPNGDDADGSPMPEWIPYTKDNHAAMEFLSDGPMPTVRNNEFNEFIKEWLDEKNLKSI